MSVPDSYNRPQIQWPLWGPGQVQHLVDDQFGALFASVFERLTREGWTVYMDRKRPHTPPEHIRWCGWDAFARREPKPFCGPIEGL